MRELLSDELKGRWTELLPRFGIPVAFLNGKHQACPLCGGKDRARFDNKDGRGTWFCTHCGAGDGVSLIMKANGIDFVEVKKRISEIVGNGMVVAPVETSDDDEDDKRKLARRAVWKASVPISLGDPAGKYLNKRCGLTAFPKCLRYVKDLMYWDDGAIYFPAMIALVSDKDGNPINIHRTYLTKDGEKAPIESPRKMMPGGAPKGCAIRLAGAEKVLGIAEGIETALSASILYEVPVWAAINSTLLSGWQPPDGIEKVIVFADCDRGFAGQAAAYVLAFKLSTKIEVEVKMPPKIGTDWNDFWLAGESI